MFLDAANELFSKAKLRVYGTEMKNLTKTDLNNKYLYSKENTGLLIFVFFIIKLDHNYNFDN